MNRIQILVSLVFCTGLTFGEPIEFCNSEKKKIEKGFNLQLEFVAKNLFQPSEIIEFEHKAHLSVVPGEIDCHWLPFAYPRLYPSVGIELDASISLRIGEATYSGLFTGAEGKAKAPWYNAFKIRELQRLVVAHYIFKQPGVHPYISLHQSVLAHLLEFEEFIPSSGEKYVPILVIPEQRFPIESKQFILLGTGITKDGKEYEVVFRNLQFKLAS